MKLNISDKTQDLFFKLLLFVVAYLIFAKPVLNYLGITKSKGDRILEREDSDPDSPFKTTYWQKYLFLPAQLGGRAISGGKMITADVADRCVKAAKNIFEAMGFFTDDEAKITAAFASLKSQAEVSLCSWYFAKNTNIDLLKYLQSGQDVMPQNGLGDYDVLTIIKFAKSLPKK